MDLDHHLSPGAPSVTYLKSGEMVFNNASGAGAGLPNGGPCAEAAAASGALLSLSLSDLMDWSSAEEDATVMFSSNAFLPLTNLSQQEVLSMVSGLGERGKYLPRMQTSTSSKLLHAALTASGGATQSSKWQANQG